MSIDLKNEATIHDLKNKVLTRTKETFGFSPVFEDDPERGNKRYDPKTGLFDQYQLGAYLSWPHVYPQYYHRFFELYGGRDFGKTKIFQGLKGADQAIYMPYFLQEKYKAFKPIPITTVVVANVKKNAKRVFEKIKEHIEFAEDRHKFGLIDKDEWTKDRIKLKNGAVIMAEGASNNARGEHGDPISSYTKLKVDRQVVTPVMYKLEEFAFWGGAKCMGGQEFVEEIVMHVNGHSCEAFTSPYGQRGGAWWAANNPDWYALQIATWRNPFTDKAEIMRRRQRLINDGRELVAYQEIDGEFVSDSGLFFPNEIWLRATDSDMEMWYSGNFDQVCKQIEDTEVRHGEFLVGYDPNSGGNASYHDPFGIALIEKMKDKSYKLRMASSFHGKKHEQQAALIKLLIKKHRSIKRINMDGGGGYGSGPYQLIKGDLQGISFKDTSNADASIKAYMSALRAAMSANRFQMPEDKDLRESQMAMKIIGDSDESLNYAKFSTTGKRSGIPCDLCAMGLALSRENRLGEDLGLMDCAPAESVDLFKGGDAYKPVLVMDGDITAGITGGSLSVGI